MTGMPAREERRRVLPHRVVRSGLDHRVRRERDERVELGDERDAERLRERSATRGLVPSEDARDLDLAQFGAMLEDEARDDAAADDADPHARILPRGLPELPAPA